MPNEQKSRRIQILREAVSRKIAAGEVIERPQSVLRELLDNALDAGATKIEVALTSGGMESLRVKDDGTGMSREDLELCHLPHATSKISTVEDLERISSLGFRGEALASVAACSRLTVISSQEENGLAWKLEVHDGIQQSLGPASGNRGTTIVVEDLFYTLPARRRFLKNPGTEGTLCRRILEEKAAAHPAVSFQLVQDGQQRLFLPQQSAKERILALESHLDPAELLISEVQEGSSRVQCFFASPRVHFRDRKNLHIYVNRRKIQEYALVQAASHAFTEFMPGGLFPLVHVFLELAPDEVDFNIHPAKKEAKFRNLSEIHPLVVKGIRDELSRYMTPTRRALSDPPRVQELFPESKPDRDNPSIRPSTAIPGRSPGHSIAPSGMGLWRQPTGAPSSRTTGSSFPALDRAARSFELPTRVEAVESQEEAYFQAPFRYLGQFRNLFLLVELEDTLLIIDQHAAHERILFDELRAQAHNIQPLLVPWRLDLDEDTRNLLWQNRQGLMALGLDLSQEGREEEATDPSCLFVQGLPPAFALSEEELKQELIQFTGDLESLARALFANLACKKAIKDGDVLDTATARQLVQRSLALPQARCPHGRPIWYALSRDQLFDLLERHI